MQLVFGKDQEVARWVMGKIAHAKGGYDPCRAIGVADGIGMVAGVVYNNYSHDNIEISCAAESPKWCRPSILRGLFAYPFEQLECRRVTCTVPKGGQSRRVRKFLIALGFKAEGVVREYFDGHDAVIYGMLKRECRWLEDAHG